MASAEEVVRLLTSIDASLKQLVASAPKPPPAVADAGDLDGQYGDPVIRAKDPKEWRGAPQNGKPFSACPPAYLDLVASRLDYFADKAEQDGTLTASGKPVAPFNRRDAARARGWAARLRSGWKPPTLSDEDSAVFGGEASPAAAAPVPPMISDEDIPFTLLLPLLATLAGSLLA